MSTKTPNNKNLTESEKLRAANYIWPGESVAHLSEETLSYYAELSLNQPESLTSTEMQHISKHLLQCDTCLGEYLLLKETLKQSIDEQSEDFRPDLPFLRQPSRAWISVKENLWRLAETISVEVGQARLHLVSLADPLQWLPPPPVATRGEAPSTAPGLPGELQIRWPHKNQVARLVLTGTSRGIHVVVLGIRVREETLTEGLAGSLHESLTGKMRAPVIGSDVALDFGVLKSGSYELELSYEGEVISLPLELNQKSP